MSEPLPRKAYLGDSVYAEVNSAMQIVLTTENGLRTDPSNTIYLELEVYRALVEFHDRRIKRARPSEEPGEGFTG